MNRTFLTFLQVATVFIGIAALAFLIRMPMLEGRAAQLDLVSIYCDPLILYGYAASIAFFVGLYQVFKLLGYAKEAESSISKSVKALKNIRICAVAFALMVIGAGLFIRFNHAEEDDPAGFLAMCLMLTFGCAIVFFASGKISKMISGKLA